MVARLQPGPMAATGSAAAIATRRARHSRSAITRFRITRPTGIRNAIAVTGRIKPARAPSIATVTSIRRWPVACHRASAVQASNHTSVDDVCDMKLGRRYSSSGAVIQISQVSRPTHGLASRRARPNTSAPVRPENSSGISAVAPSQMPGTISSA